jgi:uncharacterized protein (TIGR02145 family)
MKRSIFVLVLLICCLTNFGQQTGTFKDSRDGKVYKTIKIGTQIWMAENYAFKSDTGCWAYNNDLANVAKYGNLYNWGAAKNTCPSGWHLPTDAEWRTLISFLGGADTAGGKLKSNSGWNSPNTSASNSSGFSTLPGGLRNYDGTKFYDLGITGRFWSDSGDGYRAGFWYVENNSGIIKKGDNRVATGFSVRYIKD